MPLYDRFCNKCEHEWEYVCSMHDDPVLRCPNCDSRDNQKVIVRAPLMRCRDAGWEYENGGRGRFISQLADKQDDPAAYCRSRDEAKEKARRKGMGVEDA